MRPVPPGWAAAVAASHRVIYRAESWLKGVKLADLVILGGTVTYDATARLERRLTLTVPLVVDGVDMTPIDPSTAVLGHMGQRVHLFAGLEMPDGTEYLTDQGWYLITDWATSRESGTITLTVADLALLVDDALMGTDNCTAWGAGIAWIPGPTYRNALDFLLGGDDLGGMARPPGWGILPWATALEDIVNRVVGTNVVYQRNRMDSITALLDIVGCKTRVRDDGQLWIIPKVTALGPAVATVTEGPGGTVAVCDLAGSRSQINNYVVVYGKNDPQTSASNPFRTDPWAWAWYDSGPLASNGPFGPRTYVIDNDGINENPAANALAKAALAAGTQHAWARTVTVIPDPALELDDVVNVRMRDGSTFTGMIVGIQAPLSYQGVMNIAVTSAPPDQAARAKAANG